MSTGISFFNTLGRREEPFSPLEPGRVRMYTCGPTVHNYAHIGNLRTYIFEDTLRRMFAYFGYQVMHVMNVTDVGHLTSDADTGEDKMALGARREGKTVWEIARYYETVFFEHLQALNILRPDVVCRATEHIPEMIALIQRILENGFGYQAGGNVYFAVERFPGYSQLASLPLERLQAGARIEVDPHKRNPHDFVLWFTRSKFSAQEMKWDSPWGIGYPGWHIECSAMALKYLGERLDIHCGGVDHIPVHHTNEIAQSEAALGHRWVNYWLHSEFLLLKSSRMSKSAGGFITLADVQELGFSPLDFRYFCLGAHYRSKLQFDWLALEGACNARQALRQRYLEWLEEPSDHGDIHMQTYRRTFESAIRRDLDLPQALAITWKLAKDPALGAFQKRALLQEFDRVFALGVENWSRQALPADLQRLVDLREQARQRGDYATADSLRQQLLEAGVAIKDTPDGPRWYHPHPQ